MLQKLSCLKNILACRSRFVGFCAILAGTIGYARLPHALSLATGDFVGHSCFGVAMLLFFLRNVWAFEQCLVDLRVSLLRHT